MQNANVVSLGRDTCLCLHRCMDKPWNEDKAAYSTSAPIRITNAMLVPTKKRGKKKKKRKEKKEKRRKKKKKGKSTVVSKSSRATSSSFETEMFFSHLWHERNVEIWHARVCSPRYLWAYYALRCTPVLEKSFQFVVTRASCD